MHKDLVPANFILAYPITFLEGTDKEDVFNKYSNSIPRKESQLRSFSKSSDSLQSLCERGINPYFSLLSRFHTLLLLAFIRLLHHHITPTRLSLVDAQEKGVSSRVTGRPWPCLDST